MGAEAAGLFPCLGSLECGGKASCHAELPELSVHACAPWAAETQLKVSTCLADPTLKKSAPHLFASSADGSRVNGATRGSCSSRRTAWVEAGHSRGLCMRPDIPTGSRGAEACTRGWTPRLPPRPLPGSWSASWWFGPVIRSLCGGHGIACRPQGSRPRSAPAALAPGWPLCFLGSSVIA